MNSLSDMLADLWCRIQAGGKADAMASRASAARIADVQRQAAPSAAEDFDEEDTLDALLDVFPENAKKYEADVFADMISGGPNDDVDR